MKYFMLVPDSGAVKRVQTMLAESKLGFGVITGTWGDLLEFISSRALLPYVSNNWSETVSAALGQMPKAFWYNSWQADPKKTNPVILNSLSQVLRVSRSIDEVLKADLDDRLEKRLRDLFDLWERVDFSLPEELRLIEEVKSAISNEKNIGLSDLVIVTAENYPALETYQNDFISLFQKDDKRVSQLNELLKEVQKLIAGNAVSSWLSENLFTDAKFGEDFGEGLKFFSTRDALSEVEITVSMIQKMYEAGIPFSDIGVMMPQGQEYSDSISNLLEYANIPHAGLKREIISRDLAGEFVRSLVLLHRGGVPKMAFASLLASPLCPWEAQVGYELASNVIGGRYRLQTQADLDDKANGFLGLLEKIRLGNAPILEAVQHLVNHCDSSSFQDRLQQLGLMTQSFQRQGGSYDYEAILAEIGQVNESHSSDVAYPENGVRIFYENRECWTTVKNLFVLGFNTGHYPLSGSVDPVFLENEKDELRGKLSWDIGTMNNELAEKRELFKRQLGNAEESIYFFISQQGFSGDRLSSSESLTFIGNQLGVEAEKLIEPICDTTPWIKLADGGMPKAVEWETSKTLDLGTDLLKLKVDEDGEIYPASPTALEDMLISPFAWLLGKLNALPDEWDVDVLDPLLQGNLSHELFDRIFKVGEDLPNEKQIEALVETELADCIKKMAPFLMEDSWKVERDVLRSTLIKAVSKWNQVLTDLGAEIIKAEDWLQGRFSGIPIRGKTDQVIKLPDGKLIVVDFKKSKSGGRKKRMELGYDCQVSLYDIMLQHGDDTAGQDTGVLYFTLNDQVVLTDKDGSISDKVPSAKTIEEDVSVNALREIGESITSLRKGRVKMNYAGDAKQLSDHKGLSTFALDRSPLVNLFSVPGEDA